MAAGASAGRIEIEYVAPKQPEHSGLYEALKQRRVLEGLRDIFNPLQLPIPLTLRTVGCDGVANAWYQRPTVSVCYEYAAEIRDSMPKATTAEGVSPMDAAAGQLIYAVAHEMGHAVFDLLDIPVLGHAEDAADQFASYVILQFGKSDARRLILGAAYSYRKYVQQPTVTAPLAAFSDVHGPPAQRYFNLLCIAYGADPVLFADFLSQGYLPRERAKACAREYGEVAYAVKLLILPHVDRQRAREMLHRPWLPDEPIGPAGGLAK